MNRTRCYLMALLTLISFALSAKVNVGIEVMPEFSDRFSWEAGINLEIPVGDKLYVSPGVEYSLRHRYNQSLIEITEYHPEGNVVAAYEKASVDVRGNYISIPCLVGYKREIGSTYAIKVAGGIYYAYGFSGKSKLKLDDNGSVTQMSLPSYYNTIAKKSDYGLCVEAKCILYGHYQIGLNLQHGLRKIYQGLYVQGMRDPMSLHRVGPGIQYHQSVGLSIGYLF
ncbi:MAG: outer membrane beta-barrel protein [Muribaculaceae bacterium]|nr:outer membrane beta-barrel protein [Muribaculaceae bacterium]